LIKSSFGLDSLTQWPDKSNVLVTESTRSLYAITAEVGDYSRRLVEDGTTTLTQMAQANSPTDAFGALGAFNKRTGEEFAQHLSRLSSMFAEAARQQTLAMQSMFSLGRAA